MQHADMIQFVFTSSFRKSLKKYTHNKKILADIETLMICLQTGDMLPEKYKEHILKGRYMGFLECHIEPDLLLIYNRYENEKIIILYDIGSHSHLFG